MCQLCAHAHVPQCVHVHVLLECRLHCVGCYSLYDGHLSRGCYSSYAIRHVAAIMLKPDGRAAGIVLLVMNTVATSPVRYLQLSQVFYCR